MTEPQNGITYPKIICEKCSIPMDVIGVGSATGRLTYQCSTCGNKYIGKNLAAMQLGSRGGIARAKLLSPEKRQEIAEKAGNAFAEKMREKRKKQRLTKQT